MSKQKQILKPLSIAMGATFALSMAASNIASASQTGENPFAMNDLDSGYMQVAGKDGKCGEGKCGEGKKEKDGKCGEGKDGKCGEGKKGKDGKCGEGKKEGKKEGKCGEGKCGGK